MSDPADPIVTECNQENAPETTVTVEKTKRATAKKQKNKPANGNDQLAVSSDIAIREQDDDLPQKAKINQQDLDAIRANRSHHTQQFNSLGYLHCFAGGKERIARMAPTPIAHTSKTDRIPLQLELMERHVFINRYAHLQAVPAAINPDNLKVLHKKPAEIWLSNTNRNIVEGLCFNPEEPPLSMNEYGQLNLYQGRAVKPADCHKDESEKFIELFLDHLKQYLCHEDHDQYEAFIKVMAVKYQYLTPKTFATIIYGREGTGKDAAVEPFKRLYGAHGKKAEKAKQVTGENNAKMLSATEFLWLDEAFAGTTEATDIMKTVVFGTEINLAEKYLPLWTERNLAQVILTTNRKHIIRFATHDRRYLLLEMSEEKVGDKTYFDKLWNLIESSEFLHHLANFLLKTDTTDFNFRKPITTKSMARQKLATAEPEEKFIHKIIMDGGIRPLLIDDMPEGSLPILHWPEKMASHEMTQLFTSWLRDTRTPFTGDAAITLGSLLPKYGFTKKGSMRIKGEQGSPVRAGWEFPTLENAKIELSKILGADISDEFDSHIGKEEE